MSTSPSTTTKILLNNIEEPIFIIMDCSKYPKFTFTHIDDDANDHDITINMILKSNSIFDHIINDNNTIDLITNINCNFKQYIIGHNISINYIDNKLLEIYIPPFSNKFILTGKGIMNGNLIINIKPEILLLSEWNKINDNDKLEMIRILNAI